MIQSRVCGPHALLLTLMIVATASRADIVYPPQGYVPNALTAIQIAKAVGIAQNGFESIREKKFNAKLSRGTWVVTGSPTNKYGEVLVISISRKTGAIEDSYLAIPMHIHKKLQ